MVSIKRLIGFILILLFFCHTLKPVQAATGINKQINFQGKVANANGTNVSNASYNFLFCIYTTSSPATPCTAGANNDAIWKESKSLTVADGIFRTALGDTTAFPGSVDFNTDNIYLGVNFNSDGQMTPLVRFSAVPYAFNAEKVAGMTVTNTTGTFTLANGKTLSVANTLSFAGTDGTTITFQGTDTYVGRATTDTFTNKTIGSTGLVFSGATTDITTGTNEGLTFSPNGTGDIVFATDGDTGISFSSGFTTCTALETVSGVLTCGTDDSGGGGGTLQGAYDGDADGSNATLTLSSTDDSIVFSNPASAGTDSTFTFKVEQLNTGITNTAAYIDNRGTGESLRIDDESGDTTPFIVDADGRVGIGTSSITGSTERLLQVGSPTNRGNAAVYGDIVSQGISDITGLTNIKDVYVYDTSADTDGGRWIDWATTDQLSWYNETLDDGPTDPCVIATDDRCYTKSFPRKAILVVTTDALYIFDAATNDMWMKFSQNAAGYALGVDSNSDPSSVTALNGVIYVGTNGSSPGGLYVLDFVNDRMWNYDSTDRSGADVGIGSRNAAVTYNSDNVPVLDIATVGTVADWLKINDVSVVNITGSTTAITIGAAANTAPGSGQTFVGLATDAGLTVINLTAQRLLQYSEATDNDYTAIQLTRRGRMYALNTTLDQLERWNDYDSDKASEVNGAPTNFWDETIGPELAKTVPNLIAGAPDALEVIERGSLAEEASDIIYVGHSLGLTEIHDHSTKTNGWAKHYDTTRQTMIMPNAIDVALPLDDASGTLADDASFNNTDMTIKGSPTLGVSGVRGKAMTLNGSSQYLCSDANADGTCDLDTSFNMTTTGWTISMWFKHATNIAGTDVLFDKCYSAAPAPTAGCVNIYMTSAGLLVGALDDDVTWTAYSSYDQMATSNLAYNDNQWHQVILSRDNANDINMYIDGQPINMNTATGSTLTVDVSQMVGIGADCSVGVNCSTGANFWEGSIDDFTFSNSTTTVAQVSAAQARRLYNDARPLVGRRVINVTDATTATASTIGDSGEAWIPNEFAGMLVTLTGGTGAGQSRRVVSNTTTTMTVSANFTTTPDTTTDFEVDPEALYGASNSVYAVGITGEAPLGEARQMCIGTNDGSDGGGVTCYNHQAGPNIIADLFHADAKQLDDFSVEWTGTNYDDIRSIDLSGRALVIGSEAHMYAETRDVRLGQGLDYLANQLFNIRSEIINDGIALTGSLALEVGFTGGADLAERYSSSEQLEPGTIVSIDNLITHGVKRTQASYQSNMLGVVATEPGLILGPLEDDSYPVALVGRVPVKVTSENGFIKTGDRITSASVAGFGMKAAKAGRVVGIALEDFDATKESICPPMTANEAVCGTIMMFVNLVDYYGGDVAFNYETIDQESLSTANGVQEVPEVGMSVMGEHPLFGKILAQLKDNAQKQATPSSKIFTDQIFAAFNITAPEIYADTIFAKHIKADSIEGLELITEKLTLVDKNIRALQNKAENDSTMSAELDDRYNALISPVPTQNSGATSVLGVDFAKLQGIQVDKEATVGGSLNVYGDGFIGGIMNVIGSLTSNNLVVSMWADFGGPAIFKDDVFFFGRPQFNKDTAGIAHITQGSDRVEVRFNKEYASMPIISATLNLEEKLDDDGAVQDSTEQEKKIFDQHYSYFISKKSQKGFVIIMNKPADSDLTFSWTALTVNEKEAQSSFVDN